jgi:hypothetical protein
LTKDVRKITVAVISDLHFCDERPEGSGSQLSHIVIQKLHEAPGKNPWSDLIAFIKREKIKADYLLCPGDITTHAARGPLNTAWKGLVELGQDLQASVMACATGNHDVCSRVIEVKGDPVHQLDSPHDLFENLKLLSPEYPLHIYEKSTDHLLHRQRRTQYFGDDFVIHEDEKCRLVIFNSCARHIPDRSLYERGLLAESALTELREQLKTMTTEKINIFLCHHQPIIHTQGGTGTYDFIFRGEDLIKCLNDHGDWIIIHGHKHEGRIVYAPHGSPASAPVVFSASSVGAIFANDQLNKYRNQFYLLDIHLPAKGCSRGTTQVWNWHLGTGWSKSIDSRVGLTDGVGFGERDHPDTLAEKIANHINSVPTAWDALVNSFPFISNLTPDALNELLKSLKKHHQIVEGRDYSSNFITQLALEHK